MALTIIDGFEHQTVVSAAAGAYQTPNAVAGTPGVNTTTPRTGLAALDITAAAAAEYVSYAGLTARVISGSFYIRFVSSIPSADIAVVAFVGAGTASIRFNGNTDDKFACFIAGGRTSFGPVISTPDTWYRIDFGMDVTTATFDFRGRVDGDAGTEGIRSIGGQTPADITAIRIGTGGAETFNARYDDFIATYAASGALTPAYPIGAHTVEPLYPAADGTHSISGANEMERTLTGTDIVNATTDAWQLLDDAPLDFTMTDHVNDVGTNTASYVEAMFGNLPANSDTVLGVKGYAYDVDSAASGTNAAISRVVLADGTAVTPDLRTSADDPGTTTTMRKKMLDVPSGGWDRTKVDGLRVRMGFADGAPDAYFGGFMLEVAMLTATDQSVTHIIHTTTPTYPVADITQQAVPVVPSLVMARRR